MKWIKIPHHYIIEKIERSSSIVVVFLPCPALTVSMLTLFSSIVPVKIVMMMMRSLTATTTDSVVVVVVILVVIVSASPQEIQQQLQIKATACPTLVTTIRAVQYL